MKVEVLTVSSKGQIVIPKDIRDALKINDGDKLVAIGLEPDCIMLKTIYIPGKEEMLEEMKRVQAEVREKGIKQEEIDEIIKSVRKENRDSSRD